MKKFLAVLLAVALLGVAGAAFAADASHTEAGHNTSDGTTGDYTISDMSAFQASVLSQAGTMTEAGLKALLGDAAASIDVEAPTVSGEVVANYARKNKVVAFLFPKMKVTSPVASLNVKFKFNAAYKGIKNAKADLNEYASASVFVAAAGAKVDPTTVPDSLEATLQLTALDVDKTYEPVVYFDLADAGGAVNGTKTDGPTSNKGSGGCNAGFAGLAVLALGLVALRRKAR